MSDYYWTNDKTALLEKLWCKDSLTATQCAAILRITKNAVIGKVHRMKYPKREKSKPKAAPAPASVLKPATKQTGNNGSAGKYRGLITAARKAREAPPYQLILADDQIDALHMIANKIGRILNGDPNYADSWADIAGYAKLVADRLEAKNV